MEKEIITAVAEILACYVPFIDNLLDTITTPLAVGGGIIAALLFLLIVYFITRFGSKIFKHKSV